MSNTVDIRQAKAQISRLVAQGEAGEEVVIARADRPVARLVPYQPCLAPRAPGVWRGRVTIRRDFNAPDAEIADRFER